MSSITSATPEPAGASAPKGRTRHVSFESVGSIQVFGIWEPQADFDSFAPVLADPWLDARVE
jgi:hypothetical protein